MIGHQAVDQDMHFITLGVAGQQIQIQAPVVIEGEDFLTIVAGLGNVVSQFGYDHARASGHTSLVAKSARSSQLFWGRFLTQRSPSGIDGARSAQPLIRIDSATSPRRSGTNLIETDLFRYSVRSLNGRA